MNAGVVISARGLCKRWGDVVGLDNVSLDVHHGEVVTVIGPSGSGKSTLLRCLNALEIPDAGDVHVHGERLLADTPRANALRARVAMVFQAFHLFPHVDVIGNLTLAPRLVCGASPADARDHASELLRRVGLAGKEHARPQQLSGGERQRVAIARALAMRPDALLFDEPTSALDPESVGEVLDVMRDLAESGTTMVAVTHEIAFAAEASSRTLFMDAGRVVSEGATAQLLTRPEDARLRVFLRRVRPR